MSSNNETPQGNWNEETPLDAQNLAEFDKLCASVFKLKAEISEQEKAIDEQKAELEARQAQVMAIMKKHGKEKYIVDGYGTLSIQKNFGWTVPQDLEAKQAFFGYLREKGVLWELVNVNSRTLNSFCKAELEIAKERGDVEWNPPGLKQPSLVEKISMRKAK